MPDINSLALTAANNYKKTFEKEHLEINFIAEQGGSEFSDAAAIAILSRTGAHEKIRETFFALKEGNSFTNKYYMRFPGPFTQSQSNSSLKTLFNEENQSLRTNRKSQNEFKTVDETRR